VSDPASKLRAATRRAKSDVANKMVSMFLHELSKSICSDWDYKVDGESYVVAVRDKFGNRCPYCSLDLSQATAVVEHLDGMNRYRLGLHVPGNVLVSCRRCNNEKRRDDSLKHLVLAQSGWESFLSHIGNCGDRCKTCQYWANVWPAANERILALCENTRRIREFRDGFLGLMTLRTAMTAELSESVNKLYMDCQKFAQDEIATLLQAMPPRLANR
jgi:hypothetical protein